jgi:single-stranded DNA-binding protein
MNQIILLAEIMQPPQTRYAQDQTAIAETQARYPGLRPEDPAGTLKVVGWGNMAQEVQDKCQPGQWFIFEGRLRMNTIERPEGFKEKQVEFIVSGLHPSLPPAPATAPATASAPAQVQPRVSPTRRVEVPAMADAGVGAGGGAAKQAYAAPEPDYDDIPF